MNTQYTAETVQEYIAYAKERSEKVTATITEKLSNGTQLTASDFSNMMKAQATMEIVNRFEKRVPYYFNANGDHEKSVGIVLNLMVEEAFEFVTKPRLTDVSTNEVTNLLEKFQLEAYAAFLRGGAF